MISQAILIKLFLLIKYWLAKVYVWWKMPFVLVMLYQFRQRDLLMKNNLFDVYPRPIEPKKQYCNDPVVGKDHDDNNNNNKGLITVYLHSSFTSV